MGWFIPILLLLASIALQVVAYLLQPKPKTAKPEAAKDADNPVAEYGTPLPVVFGNVTVKGLNVLRYSDKNKHTYQIDA